LLAYDVFTLGCLFTPSGCCCRTRSTANGSIRADIGLLGFVSGVVNDILHVERVIRTGFFAPSVCFSSYYHRRSAVIPAAEGIYGAETQRTELRDTLESLKQR